MNNEIISKLKKDLQLNKALENFCCSKLKSRTDFDHKDLTKINIKYKNKEIANSINLNINKNYSGIGQEKVKNKDGYFTTFTTIENHKKTYIEYKQNADSSWSNNQYWGGTMAENGCGITALATILSGYNKNYTPEDLRQQYYPKLNYDILSKELSNTFNIKNTDFYYDLKKNCKSI